MAIVDAGKSARYPVLPVDGDPLVLLRHKSTTRHSKVPGSLSMGWLVIHQNRIQRGSLE